MGCTRFSNFWLAVSLGSISLAACTADSDKGNRQGAVLTVADAGGDEPIETSFGNPSADAAANPVVGCDGGCVTVVETAVPDDDGFTVAEGDCDDFSALVNPGAFDVPGNGVDEDCQGGDAADACDQTLDIASTDPLDAASAIELCARTDESSRRWGVISARWTTPDGLGVPAGPLMYGILPGFGSAFAPRGGQKLLALSSGVARAADQPGFTPDCSDPMPGSSTNLPEGFDGASPSCPIGSAVTTVTDGVALELRLRVPSNASSLSFDSAFFTNEYPAYICSQFNDFFQVLVQPRRDGAQNDNVVFDLDGNSVSVNNSMLRACQAGTFAGKTFDCPLGFDPLLGTGYDNCGQGVIAETDAGAGTAGTGGTCGIFGCGIFGGGAVPIDPSLPGQAQNGASTGWLGTEIAVKAGEVITVRIAVWDSGDSALDSLAILDHVRFGLLDAPPPPKKPVTKPIVVE